MSEFNNDDKVTDAKIIKLLDQWVTVLEHGESEMDFFYPESRIGEHCVTTGTPLREAASKGVHVMLHWKNQVKTQGPLSAEVFSHYVDNEVGIYADMGLTWEGQKLVDYDGADNLPGELREALKHYGYDVSEMEETKC